jgi:hypothetical protein
VAGRDRRSLRFVVDECAAGGVFEEAGDLRVDGDVEDGLPRQAGLAEVAEPLMVPQLVMNVGEAQRPGVKRIPAPGDVVDIERGGT